MGDLGLKRRGLTSRRHAAVGILLAVAFASGLAARATPSAWGQDTGLADRAAAMHRRGQKLLARLQRGDTVRIVAFGDSLTAGWGTDGRHVYCRMVADALQYAFPGSKIELVTHGHPGETTEDALRRFDAEVVAAKPDLLLVQFGGNDKGWGRPIGDFKRDLGRLLRQASVQTDALVIGCLAPIVDPNPANAWCETARAVATSEGVPAADLDRAIRNGDGDSRGPFPYGSHPGGFTHLIMAREVLRAVRESAGLGQPLACRLRGGTRLTARSTYELEIEVSNLSDTPMDCALQLEWQDAYTSLTGDTNHAVHLASRTTARLKHTIPLPTFGGRSRSFPVRLFARGGGLGDIDVCWLAIAAAVKADSAAVDQVASDALTWHELAGASLVLGQYQWLGRKDLSGRFAAVALPDRIRFIVDVADDDITTADASDPSRGDSVELYLDLRDDANQGKPVYTSDVLAIQAMPPTRAGDNGQWRSMQPLPDRFKDISAKCTRTHGGYRAQVDVPVAAISASRGQAWRGFGFDVGINDADSGGVRKAQMMWTRFPDSYLNPAYLGWLSLDDLSLGATRQTLR